MPCWSWLAVGVANAQTVPVSLMAKLPLEFLTLAKATHQAFETISTQAQDMGDAQLVLTQLGELIQNCTGYHAGYRFDVGIKGK
jgi:hypothetical protein